MKKILLLLLIVLFCPIASRAYGDAVVITHVGPPGFPESSAAEGQVLYVGTPGTPNPTSLLGPSKLRKYHQSSGALLAEWTIVGEDLTQPHGLFGIALDAAGRVYACEQQSKIFRIDPVAGTQSTYASIPDLPPCSSVTGGACSPTLADQPAFPDDLVFDSAGNAYVTDILQATIWKIPPGGNPSAWFQDAALDGVGVNGVRLDPSRTSLYVTVSQPAPNVLTGGIYRISLLSPALQLVRAYASGPDGLAVGASGLIYVALPFENAVAVVDPSSGAEIARFLGPASSSLGPVPFDTPTSVTFIGAGAFALTNNSASGNPLTTALIDVYANDQGDPLERPTIP